MSTLAAHNEGYDLALSQVSHVVITGNVIDGIQVHGPFTSHDDAMAWAEEHVEVWYVAKINNVSN